MRQATNKVKITGLLSEVDLQDASFTGNDGNPVEVIRGTIKVKVDLPVGDKTILDEIPIQVFAKKYKNDGSPNSAYDDWKKVKDEYVSIAAGGEDSAQAISVTGANVQENTYYNQMGTKVSYTRIRGSFVRAVDKSRMVPEASWELEFVVANKKYLVDDDGVETDKYCINAIIPQYGGSVDVVPIYTTNPRAIQDIEQWEEGSTMKAYGYLNFTVGEAPKKVVVDDTWGEIPELVTESGTRSVSELIITKASGEPLTGEFAFDPVEINNALAEREARIEADKDKKASGTKGTKKAPAKGKATFTNLGF